MVSIAINGIFKAKQIPLAVADPILNPVYEPGPSEIDTALISLISKLDFRNSSVIYTCKTSECE